MIKTLAEYLNELNNTDEHQKIEAKTGAGKSLLETVSSFSNEPGLGGGTILVGVKRDDNALFPNYSLAGISNPDKVSSDIASECASVFSTPIRPNINTVEHDSKIILVIEVPEANSSQKPVYFKKRGLPQGAFRRIGSTDQKCTDEDLVSLFSQRGILTFDETTLDRASMEDIDPEAIDYYRKLRSNVNPDAEELNWSDTDLLLSLSAIEKHKNRYIPTVTGILLFGSRKSLRRLVPMFRVDYIRVPGKEWVENPDERFSTTDMRGTLLQLAQRVQNQIFEDIPKPFSLEEGRTQAQSQSLPSRVLREAVVNALMHASFRANQPIQVIRYSNRIEIRNPGYSLKNPDKLGEPGSRPRNPKIAAVFHETNLAETKGSGIRTIRNLMKKNGFVPPTFESSRDNDSFTIRLFLHHFLEEADFNWLANINKTKTLTDSQKRAIFFVRESGAIDNQTYRQLNGVDTLVASAELRHLRDIELFKTKGKGPSTYYVAGDILKNHISSTNTHQFDENTHQSDENTHQSDENTHQLPNEYTQILENLGKKPRREKTKTAILKLCSWKELSAEELAKLLKKKDKKHLVRDLLKPLVKKGKLAYTYPDMVNHPKQKYRRVTS